MSLKKATIRKTGEKNSSSHLQLPCLPSSPESIKSQVVRIGISCA